MRSLDSSVHKKNLNKVLRKSHHKKGKFNSKLERSYTFRLYSV